jgi:hypothetical protein
MRLESIGCRMWGERLFLAQSLRRIDPKRPQQGHRSRGYPDDQEENAGNTKG